jgi:hypothetical protein
MVEEGNINVTDYYRGLVVKTDARSLLDVLVSLSCGWSWTSMMCMPGSAAAVCNHDALLAPHEDAQVNRAVPQAGRRRSDRARRMQS